jgi:hypothetical protein
MTFLDTSTATDLVVPALARALAEVRDVSRSEVADTGTYTYRYVSLGAVMAAVKLALVGEGLSLAQSAHTDADSGMVYVSTTLFHAGDDSRDGQWVTFPPLGLRLGQTAQATGSAISYARRYALMSIFGITGDDDDAATSTADPGQSPYRSDEERRIHELFAAHSPEVGSRVRADFRAHFRQGLSTLPFGRHADALLWVQQALANETASETIEPG